MNAVRLPHLHHRAAELEIDLSDLPTGVAETLRQSGADWVRMTTEAPFRATLSRRLLTLMDKTQTGVSLDRFADHLGILAASCEEAHQRGRIAAWRVLADDSREVAA